MASELKKQVRRATSRPDNDLREITTRFQQQVQDLVDRAAGVKEARREAFAAGILIGGAIGLLLGAIVGTRIAEQSGEKAKTS